jgi:hypothetical protein
VQANDDVAVAADLTLAANALLNADYDCDGTGKFIVAATKTITGSAAVNVITTQLQLDGDISAAPFSIAACGAAIIDVGGTEATLSSLKRLWRTS